MISFKIEYKTIFTLIILLFQIFLFLPYHYAKINNEKHVIDNIVDIKDFKKLLRTKTNVLVCFISSLKQSAPLIKTFKETAAAIKGHGTLVQIDCSG